MAVEQQVMIIFAATNGFLDDAPVEDVKRFEQEFILFVESRHPQIGEHIRSEGTLPDDVAEQLREAIKEFRETFQVSEGHPPLKEAAAPPLMDEQQEVLKKYRRPRPEEIHEKAGPAGKSEVQLPG
jgi:F-type H+-transporting ATPase subunit alpha